MSTVLTSELSIADQATFNKLHDLIHQFPIISLSCLSEFFKHGYPYCFGDMHARETQIRAFIQQNMSDLIYVDHADQCFLITDALRQSLAIAVTD